MNRTVRAAGIAACLGLSLILVGSVLGTGSPRDAALPAPIPADTDPATPGANGQTKPVAATTSKPPAGSIPANQAITELRGRGKGAPSLVIDSSGTIKAVTAATGKTLAPQRDAFATRYAAGFGAGDTTKLKATTSAPLPGGDSVTHYQQTVAGLPVMGGELVVTTNARGGVRSAISALSGYSPKATTAKISADTARSIAVKAIGERYAITPDLITDASVKLWLADQSKFGSNTAGLRPTYWVQLSGANGLDLADILVDALDGSVKLAVTEQQTAKKRRVCDQGNVKVDLRYVANYACAPGSAFSAKPTTRVENGDNGPTSSVADVNKAYDLLGMTYDYYKSTFGLDSFDGRGAEIQATVRVCDVGYACPYRNAFWDGSQFAFGEGWVVDDVVAHEFTHAVTEHSSGLYYWYESGAINEALSDIMGQFVDLKMTPGDEAGSSKWLLGEALNGPTQFGPVRSMSSPNDFGDPQTYGGAYWFNATPGVDEDNGGVHYNSGVANKLAYLIADGTGAGTFNGYNIAGLDLLKSEQLWYRVMHLLSSGADYRELRLALTSACQEFIGHLGFTVSDCAQVQKAINAVQLPPAVSETEYQWPFCPNSPYQPPADLFFDNFEHGASKWRFSATNSWQLIPSSVVPYSYAASGKGSINGWTYNKTAANGTGTYAELVSPVALPAGKPAYLHLASSMIKDAGGAVNLYVQANGGAWEHNLQIYYATRGYGATLVDLSAYAGKSVKVRLQIDSAYNYIDWYMDDFRIYNCDGRPSAPTNPVAYLDGTTIKASWGLPQFAGTGPSSWDVTVSPTSDPSQLVRSSSGGSEMLDIVAINPNLTYTITIRYVSNGQVGEPVKLVVAPYAPVSCQSKLVLNPFTLYSRLPEARAPQPCVPPRITPRRP